MSAAKREKKCYMGKEKWLLFCYSLEGTVGFISSCYLGKYCWWTLWSVKVVDPSLPPFPAVLSGRTLQNRHKAELLRKMKLKNFMSSGKWREEGWIRWECGTGQHDVWSRGQRSSARRWSLRWGTEQQGTVMPNITELCYSVTSVHCTPQNLHRGLLYIPRTCFLESKTQTVSTLS